MQRIEGLASFVRIIRINNCIKWDVSLWELFKALEKVVIANEIKLVYNCSL